MQLIAGPVARAAPLRRQSNALVSLFILLVFAIGCQVSATVALAAFQSPSGAAAWQQAARQQVGRGMFVSGIYATEVGLVLTGLLAGLKALAPQPRGAWQVANLSRCFGRWLISHSIAYCIPAAILALVLYLLTGPRVQVLPGIYAPGDAFPRCEHEQDAVMAALGLQILAGSPLQRQCLPWAYPAAMLSLGTAVVAVCGVWGSFLARWLQHLGTHALSRFSWMRGLVARLSYQRLTEEEYAQLDRAPQANRPASRLRGSSSPGAGERDDGSLRRRRTIALDASRGGVAEDGEFHGAEGDGAGVPTGVHLVCSPAGVTATVFVVGFGLWLVLRCFSAYGTEAKSLILDAGAANEAVTLLRSRPSLFSLGGAVLGGASTASVVAHRQLWQRAGRIRTVAATGALVLAMSLLFADWYGLSLLAVDSAWWRAVCERLYGPTVVLAWCGAVWGALRLRLDSPLDAALAARPSLRARLRWISSGTVTASLLQPPVAMGLLWLSGLGNEADPAAVSLLALLAGSVALVGGAVARDASCLLQRLLGLRHQYALDHSMESSSASVSPFGTLSGETGAVLVDALLPRTRTAPASAAPAAAAGTGATGGTAASHSPSTTQLQLVLAELPQPLRAVVTEPSLSPADVAFLVGRATEAVSVAGVFRVDLPARAAGAAGASQPGATASAERRPALTEAGEGDGDEVGSDATGSDATESSGESDGDVDSEDEGDEDGSIGSSGASASRFRSLARAMLAICSHPSSSEVAADGLSELCIAWEEETGATTQATLQLLRAASNEAAAQLSEAEGMFDLPEGAALA